MSAGAGGGALPGGPPAAAATDREAEARRDPDPSERLDVLIPTRDRPAALAVTLTSLLAQQRPLRVVVSDQGDRPASESGEVAAIVRVLQVGGHEVEVLRHLPRRGMAEQRQFLLDRARSAHALAIDDDVILGPGLVPRMVRALREQGCGFVGCGLIGLGHLDDVRPHEQSIELWDGPVTPEVVRPGSAAWDRHRIHSAANLWHVQRRLGLTADTQRLYRVAWVGGCVLWDVAALRDAGGFMFWERLPAEHAGEDVLAQLRVMARRGGAGLIPSAAFHQQLPTTVTDRRVDAPFALPDALPADPGEAAASRH